MSPPGALQVCVSESHDGGCHGPALGCLLDSTPGLCTLLHPPVGHRGLLFRLHLSRLPALGCPVWSCLAGGGCHVRRVRERVGCCGLSMSPCPRLLLLSGGSLHTATLAGSHPFLCAFRPWDCKSSLLFLALGHCTLPS